MARNPLPPRRRPKPAAPSRAAPIGQRRRRCRSGPCTGRTGRLRKLDARGLAADSQLAGEHGLPHDRSAGDVVAELAGGRHRRRAATGRGPGRRRADRGYRRARRALAGDRHDDRPGQQRGQRDRGGRDRSRSRRSTRWKRPPWRSSSASSGWNTPRATTCWPPSARIRARDFPDEARGRRAWWRKAAAAPAARRRWPPR